MSDMNIFKKTRLLAGFDSIHRLAKTIGVNSHSIEKWENGKTKNIKNSMLAKLKAAYPPEVYQELIDALNPENSYAIVQASAINRIANEIEGWLSARLSKGEVRREYSADMVKMLGSVERCIYFDLLSYTKDLLTAAKYNVEELSDSTEAVSRLTINRCINIDLLHLPANKHVNMVSCANLAVVVFYDVISHDENGAVVLFPDFLVLNCQTSPRRLVGGGGIVYEQTR